MAAAVSEAPMTNPLHRTALGMLTAAINHALRGEAWARERLAKHAGKTVRLDVAPWAVTAVVMEDGLLGAALDAATADVSLALPASALPLIALGAFGDGVQTTAMRHVRIVGDAELAHLLSTLFQHLRWDVEEDLSRVVGDAAAHRLVASAQAVVGQAEQARRRLTDNLVEYLTEEQPTLVTRAQLNAHAEAVRTLADDLDRLEKRLARLR
jgi:ubiquinone biosynthesis accessory factor UbiJ